MSDKFVTVATFNKTFEAQLAKNLLENEGITSMMGGAISSDMLFGSLALGDQIVLQVHEEDAQRAARVLATAAAEARLDDDWEEQAEADVWICSICGEPISNRLSMCYSCQTPKDGIRADAPRTRDAIRTDAATMSSGEEIQKHDETTEPTAPDNPASSESAGHEEENIDLPTATGDALAHKAFLATVFGLAVPILLPLAWVCLFRAALVPTHETSAKGLRYFYLSLTINIFILAAVYLFYLYLRG